MLRHIITGTATLVAVEETWVVNAVPRRRPPKIFWTTSLWTAARRGIDVSEVLAILM